MGELNTPARELRVSSWIDAGGKQMHMPVTLADLGAGQKIIYTFQHCCPGCHAPGFPTLRALHDNLKNQGQTYPAYMQDYRTAGTPWFTVIEPSGNVVYADFRLDPARFFKALGADDLGFEAA